MQTSPSFRDFAVAEEIDLDRKDQWMKRTTVRKNELISIFCCCNVPLPKRRHVRREYGLGRLVSVLRICQAMTRELRRDICPVLVLVPPSDYKSNFENCELQSDGHAASA